MLAIRLQRKGRKGHAQSRVIVQESRLSPASGKVVQTLGNFDPHSKVTTLDAEKAKYYMDNGAQPSNSVARLFKREGVKMPDWVEVDDKKQRTTKNAEKLRKNQPKVEAPAEEAVSPAIEQPTEDATEADVSEEKAEEPKEETAEKTAQDTKEPEEKTES